MTLRETSPLTKALIWIMLVFIVLALGVAVLSQSDYAGGTQEVGEEPTAVHAAQRQRRSDDDLGIEACMAAQEAVKAELKAPATAKFPGCVFGAHEYDIRADEARTTVWVRGHVDAQNSFGAMLRTEFGVKLVRSGDRLTPVQTVLDH